VFFGVVTSLLIVFSFLFQNPQRGRPHH
jgi:hypothetical protein